MKTPLTFLLSLTFLFLFSGFSPTVSWADVNRGIKFFELGSQFLQKRQYSAAINYFKQSLENFKQARHQIGISGSRLNSMPNQFLGFFTVLGLKS
ncbi:MAG: hypothetical protein HOB32_07390 [Nitrospina sp.]|nr:hypothetical protein [Nitrospina sp.]